jgi:hypothetical protein
VRLTRVGRWLQEQAASAQGQALHGLGAGVGLISRFLRTGTIPRQPLGGVSGPSAKRATLNIAKLPRSGDEPPPKG